MNTEAVSSNWILILCFVTVLLFDSSSCEVEQIATNAFNQFISDNELALVLFKSPNECLECNKALEYMGQVPQPDLVQTEIVKGHVADDKLAAQYGASSYPSVVYFRNKYPALYHGKLTGTDDIPEFMDWLTTAAEIATKDLFDDSFEHLTQASTGATTGDWFVLFYKPGCEDCMNILPAVESAAIRVKHRMNFAKVDVDVNKKLVERFHIKSCPEGILFKQGKMYRYEPEKFDTQSLVSFVDAWYKNVKASPIPKEPTAFDILTESIAMSIKKQLNDPDRKWMFVAMVIGACLLIVTIVIFVFRKPAESRIIKGD